MIMLAKGNRSQQVTDARKTWRLLFGSIGGPAAVLGTAEYKHLECVEYPNRHGSYLEN